LGLVYPSEPAMFRCFGELAGVLGGCRIASGRMDGCGISGRTGGLGCTNGALSEPWGSRLRYACQTSTSPPWPRRTLPGKTRRRHGVSSSAANASSSGLFQPGMMAGS